MGLPAAVPTIDDAAVQKENFGSGTVLAFLNEEVDDIMKIVRLYSLALERSHLLTKGVIEAGENEVKEKRRIYRYISSYNRFYFIGKHVIR